MSTLWKLYDMVITARMKVCARVDPSMSTASKGVDARHNLHLAVDIVALRASRDECQKLCVKDLERGFPTCERNDVALSQRAHGVSAHIVEAKAAMNADVRVVIKVAPGYHTAEIPTGRGIPEGAHGARSVVSGPFPEVLPPAWRAHFLYH